MRVVSMGVLGGVDTKVQQEVAHRCVAGRRLWQVTRRG